jgi:hypothetical protein
VFHPLRPQETEAHQDDEDAGQDKEEAEDDGRRMQAEGAIEISDVLAPEKDMGNA